MPPGAAGNREIKYGPVVQHFVLMFDAVQLLFNTSTAYFAFTFLLSPPFLFSFFLFFGNDRTLSPPFRLVQIAISPSSLAFCSVFRILSDHSEAL